jgi:hypothetical protein
MIRRAEVDLAELPLALIQTLALHTRGLTAKPDMAQDASTRRNDAVSSQSPANAAAEEDIYRRNVWPW